MVSPTSWCRPSCSARPWAQSSRRARPADVVYVYSGLVEVALGYSFTHEPGPAEQAMVNQIAAKLAKQ